PEGTGRDAHRDRSRQYQRASVQTGSSCGAVQSLSTVLAPAYVTAVCALSSTPKHRPDAERTVAHQTWSSGVAGTLTTVGPVDGPATNFSVGSIVCRVAMSARE